MGAVIKNDRGGKGSQEVGLPPPHFSGRSSSRVQNLLYILRNHISFQVHLVAGLKLREISYFPGLGYHSNVKMVGGKVRNRQTNSFHRDGSLEHQVLRNLARILNPHG